ncbi:hypothetical protein N9D31_00305 [Oligoflexaceae bacterium]|nr:hypothetical protein [Oligoflexaceae bacterium]
MIKKTIFSAVLAAGFGMGCGSEDSGGDSNGGLSGPEDPINNTASADDFKSSVDESVEVFDDYSESKKEFVGESGSGFSQFHWSQVVRAAAFDDSETASEEQLKTEDLKKEFEGISSCVSSFAQTDQYILGLKSVVEEIIKELKEGKSVEEVEGTETEGVDVSGSPQYTEVESDAAIAYQIAPPEMEEGVPDGYSLSGSISGSYNEETKVYQFYKKIDLVVDYDKLFGQIQDQLADLEIPEEADDDDFDIDFSGGLSGSQTSNNESTIEIDLTNRTAKISSSSSNNTIFTDEENAEDSVKVDMQTEATMTGGENPSYTSTVKQTVVQKDETNSFEFDMSLTVEDKETMLVEMKINSDDSDDDVEFSYKLKADTGDECSFESVEATEE